MPIGTGQGGAAIPSACASKADDASFGAGNANAVAVLPAKQDRIFAIITADSGNSDNIRVGDADVDTGQGTQLQAGDSIEWRSKSACYVCAEAGAAVGDNSVALTEYS